MGSSNSAEAKFTAGEETVLRVLQEVFDAMEAKDAEGMRARMTKDGWGTQSRDHHHFVERLWDIPSRDVGPTKRITEIMHDPLVRVDDDIAMVWCAYDLYRDDVLHHSGTNIVSFLKTDEGWKICSITSNGISACR
jgi:hypothetical protein